MVSGRPHTKNASPVMILTNTLLLVSCLGKKSITPLVTVSNIPNCQKQEQQIIRLLPAENNEVALMNRHMTDIIVKYKYK